VDRNFRAGAEDSRDRRRVLPVGIGQMRTVMREECKDFERQASLFNAGPRRLGPRTDGTDRGHHRHRASR
jgi:hypothetical protein